jgi:hypothetical protein
MKTICSSFRSSKEYKQSVHPFVLPKSRVCSSLDGGELGVHVHPLGRTYVVKTCQTYVALTITYFPEPILPSLWLQLPTPLEKEKCVWPFCMARIPSLMEWTSLSSSLSVTSSSLGRFHESISAVIYGQNGANVSLLCKLAFMGFQCYQNPIVFHCQRIIFVHIPTYIVSGTTFYAQFWP